MPKKIYIRTFGCQMNNADSELVYGMLLSRGHTKANSFEDADVILFNTCSVRKHAEDRVWGKIGELKRLRKRDCFVADAKAKAPRNDGKERKPIIGIIGCMAKAQGKKIFERLPQVSFICSPSDIYEIPDLIEQAGKNPKRHFAAISRRKRPLKQAQSPQPKAHSPRPIAQLYRENPINALVNITYGCNNLCSYCIVPYARGAEISRKPEDIIDEIKAFVDDGVKEVMLLGQNVNSYSSKPTAHSPQPTAEFVKLLERVNKISGLLRIRFMTSHPKDANINLFKAMRDLDKVCEHLHLPLQSAADRILKLMNRKYTSSEYLKLVEQYRKIVKGGSLTTDVIVGFPTETEEEFYKTYMLMKEVKFDTAFIFKYSPRPRTAAYKMKDDVETNVKEQRNQSLLSLQSEIRKDNNKLLINTVQQALANAKARREPANFPKGIEKNYLKGRTRQNQQVIYAAGPELIGQLCDVRIVDVDENTLVGEKI
ncbi:MAG: tRNA (N6-isopentenyl adenosine(37)-C2)-methylthiotransferase MiaB [Candidatus Omnitrophota bacterium]